MTFANPVNLRASLDLSPDRFSPALDRASRSLGNFESGLGRVGRGAGQLGSGLARLATIGIGAAVGGLTAATVAAVSFEDAFAGIRKTVDEADLAAAGLTFDELAVSIRGMAREMPIAAADLAQIGEAAGALGIRAADIDDFIAVVAKLSVTTDLTADAAATALGQLGTTLHLSGGDFEDFADSLVALGNAGASTESQIIEIASRFASAGISAGLSKEEVLALASAVASMGIEVEAGGTALSQTFNGIAVAIGTGSDEVKAFTEVLGISADEFKQRFSEDALGTFTAFLAKLSTLDQFEVARILTEAGITGQRQLNAVKLMTQNLGFFSDQLRVATTATGALGVEAQKRFETTASQLKILQNNLTDVGITIGSELLPVITDLTREFVDFLNEPGMQRGLQTFAKDLAQGIRDIVREVRGMDFDPFIKALGFMAEVGGKVVDLFRQLPPDIQALAITGLALNKLSGGLLGAGVGNIAGGILQIVFRKGDSPANPLWVASVGGGVGGGAPGGGAGIAGFLGTLGAVLGGLTIGTLVGNELIRPTLEPAQAFQRTRFEAVLASGDAERISGGIAAIDAALESAVHDPLERMGLFLSGSLDILSAQRRELVDRLNQIRTHTMTAAARLAEENAGRRADAARALSLQASSLGSLQQIAAKPTTVHTVVNTSVNVSAYQTQTIVQRLESMTYAQLREG